MNTFDKSQYKKFLDYPAFCKTIWFYSIDSLNEADFEKINAKCLNKNFMYIKFFEEWVTKPTCVMKNNFTIKDSFKSILDSATKESFQTFNLYPFVKNADKEKADKRSLFPVIDISSYIKCINIGKESDVLKKIMSKSLGSLKDEKGKTKTKDKNPIDLRIIFDSYLNETWDKKSQATAGGFIEILDAIGEIPDAYLGDKPPENGVKFGTVVPQENNNNIILNNIKTINAQCAKFDSLTEVQMLDLEFLIDDTAERIVKIMQTILEMYVTIYNLAIENTNSSAAELLTFSTQDIISKASSGSIPIEKSLALAKPVIKPSFKKSYIMRENNLTPFISIKMYYYAQDGRVITINNFNIPYNSILSLEHNIKEHSITINLIDMEGMIGELLIQKLYAVSQKRTNLRKIDSGDALSKFGGKLPKPERPYLFVIEYGWAGPETEDEDELLEEDVFVKTSTRGYIKSISSQYSFKGNEYTLTILPNDQESINKFMNNSDLMYFNAQHNELSIVTGVMTLFFIIYTLKEGTTKSGSLEVLLKNKFKKEIDKGYSLLECLFLMIEDVQLIKKDQEYYFHYKGADLCDDTTELSVKKGDSMSNEINEIIKSMCPSDKNDTWNVKDITYNTAENSLERLKKAVSAGTFSLNAWLVAVYLIWKLKRYYKNNPSHQFLLHDTTGLFDIFDDNRIIVKDDQIIGQFKLDKVIKIFNPFCQDNEKTFDLMKVLGTCENAIKKSKDNFNQYPLENIIEIEPDEDTDETKPKQLTFFTNQISSLFASIKNIGMRKSKEDAAKHNIYLTSNAISADYTTLSLEDNNHDLVMQEYKRRIYADKHNIFSEKGSKERHINSYNNFKSRFETIISDAESKASAKKKLIEKEKNTLETEKKKKKKEEELKIAKENKAKGKETQAATKERKDKIGKEWAEAQLKIDSEYAKKEKEFENEVNKQTIKFLNILYLSYRMDPNKTAFLNCPLDLKISMLGKQLTQSYSFTPRIFPKTRNSNKQFFGQGNSSILKEGSGDIIEFSIDPIDIGNFNSLMLSNKNKNNVGFNNLSSNSNISNIYQNAANYYRTYRDMDGNVGPKGIAQDMARLDLNYQSQTNIKGSITIIGEPYWSNINLMMAKCIYVHVYYANGQRSSHSGLYYVNNATQNIADGKFTTKLEIIRAPTFLSSLEKLANKNKYLG